MPSTRRSLLTRLLALLAPLVLAAAPASATWSIILIDTRTGEIAVGSATCLTTFDLQKWTPVVLTGVGAGVAQASVNGVQFANRTYIRDRLALGTLPSSIIGALNGLDAIPNSRQYGIADVLGRRAVFTGVQTSQWAGGRTGSFEYTYAGHTGTIVYSIQGNILTGLPVVELAVAAARDTPGDLPHRLMAAMEAARAAGGDGRCSCTTGGPMSCGSPPPSFTKSAHIGYMLIARAGDTDGSHGYYRAGSSTADLAAADLTGDGLPDIVTANTGGSSASFLRNLSTPPGRFPRMGLPTQYTTGALPRAVALADITGDGLPDLVTTASLAGELSVRPGLGDGAFGAPAVTTVGGRPGALAVADLDGVNGPDVAFIDEVNTNVSVLLNSGIGGLLPPVTYTGTPGQSALIIADFDADSHADLVILSATQSRIALLHGDGSGAFMPIVEYPLANPHAIATGHFNTDTEPDFAIVKRTAPPALIVLTSSDVPGHLTPATYPLPAAPNHVAVGDISGDGLDDLVIPVDGGRFLTFRGLSPAPDDPGDIFVPDGDFDLTTDFATSGIARAILTDIDADGDLDAVFAVSPFDSIVIAENRGGGAFIDSAGTASGDYFMTFNVPNQPAAAPDPVFQLQDMFAAWRADHTGRPDAVQSLVTVPTLIAGSSNTGVMTITLRDWQGNPITAPISSFTIEQQGDGTAHVSVTSIANPAPGVYEATMAASTSFGSNRFIITADDGTRPIILMPNPEVTAGACPADWNYDGVVNANDLSSFLTAWLASINNGTLIADYDDDGQVNSSDITAFLSQWLAAITGNC